MGAQTDALFEPELAVPSQVLATLRGQAPRHDSICRLMIAVLADALGIAQRERSNGCTSMPLCSRKPLMSRIEAIAMKMSSPKNTAMLSTAAQCARIRKRTVTRRAYARIVARIPSSGGGCALKPRYSSRS